MSRNFYHEPKVRAILDAKDKTKKPQPQPNRRYRVEYEMPDGSEPKQLDYIEAFSIPDAERQAKALCKAAGAVGYMIFDGDRLVEQWSERRNA